MDRCGGKVEAHEESEWDLDRVMDEMAAYMGEKKTCRLIVRLRVLLALEGRGGRHG